MKRSNAKQARRAGAAMGSRARSRSRTAQLLDEVREVVGGDVQLEHLLTRLTTGLKAITSKDQETAGELAALRFGNEGRLIALREAVLRGALSSDQVAELLGKTRPTIHTMVKGGLLLAIRDGRALRFPAWQFADTADALIPGIRLVLEVADASALRTASWLVTLNRRLQNRAPLDLLRTGDHRIVELVVSEARVLTSF